MFFTQERCSVRNRRCMFSNQVSIRTRSSTCPAQPTIAARARGATFFPPVMSCWVVSSSISVKNNYRETFKWKTCVFSIWWHDVSKGHSSVVASLTNFIAFGTSLFPWCGFDFLSYSFLRTFHATRNIRWKEHEKPLYYVDSARLARVFA